MKYCQGPKCHTYRTKDRIRGPKGNKFYQTRRRSHMYYNGNFCSLNCQDDWFERYGEQAINHFGRIHEPIKLTENNAWYKYSDYNGYDNTPRYNRFFVNDLTNQRIPITEEQYNNPDLVRP
jgi:hypothetical protein